MFSRKEPSPAGVVAVRMREHDSLHTFWRESSIAEARGNPTIAQAGVNQHTSFIALEKRGIARASAAEDSQLGASQALTRIPKSSYR